METDGQTKSTTMQAEQRRPQTSTRDLEDLRQRLELWIGRQLPPGAEPRVSALDVPPSSGMSSETLGDARVGNILYRDFEPVAVLDWEMAALGPRELDLGWLIYIHRFFEDMAAQFGQPGMPHFLRREDVTATYESMSGHRPRDLDFYTMYAALRHGIHMNRIRRRAIRFGESTMPDDVDDLVWHRSTLEEMLACTYWPRILSAEL